MLRLVTDGDTLLEDGAGGAERPSQENGTWTRIFGL
jgi:hypothetical protein